MKKSLAPKLAFALLVLGIAGIAWAGQVAVQAPQDPAVDPAPGVDLPAQGAEPDVTLEELFQDPADVGACCFAECFEEFSACRQSCSSLPFPEREACLNQCMAEHEDCTAGC